MLGVCVVPEGNGGEVVPSSSLITPLFLSLCPLPPPLLVVISATDWAQKDEALGCSQSGKSCCVCVCVCVCVCGREEKEYSTHTNNTFSNPLHIHTLLAARSLHMWFVVKLSPPTHTTHTTHTRPWSQHRRFVGRLSGAQTRRMALARAR
jgi:hypothetical protein